MSREDGSAPPRTPLAVIVVAAVTAGALFGVATATAVVVRPHGALLGAVLSVAVGLGFALIGLWLCLVLRRLGALGDGGSDTDGEGWGRETADPTGPRPSPEDLWPAFERELRAYLEAREREPVAG
jgi:hypothetical protein